MPLVSLHTNAELSKDQEITIARQLSTLASHQLGKPEQWVMIRVAAGQSMIHAGSEALCAYLECKSIGLNEAQIPALSKAISSLLQQQLHIDPARVYIEFASAQAQHWGWNGGTF